MNGQHAAILVLVAVLILFLAGCAASPNTDRNTPNQNGDVAGFWQGLWHGFILPVTFIISLFNDSVAIYDVHNNGHWYDFGFILGAAIVSGVLTGGGRTGRRAARA